LASRIKKVLTKRIWRIPIFLLLVVVFGAYVIVSVIAAIPHFTHHFLTFEVRTDKRTYTLNETISVHLTLFNPTLAPVKLHFGTSYRHDFIILDEDNNELYKWSDSMGFLWIDTEIHIAPLSRHTRTLTHYSFRYQLQPGNYTIRGVIVGYHGWGNPFNRNDRFKDTTIRIVET